MIIYEGTNILVSVAFLKCFSSDSILKILEYFASDEDETVCENVAEKVHNALMPRIKNT